MRGIATTSTIWVQPLDQRYPTYSVARWLGIDLDRVPQGWCGLCPLHVDTHPSFFVFVRNGVERGFYCYGCNEGGSAAYLLSKARSIPLLEAEIALLDGRSATEVALARLGDPRTTESDSDKLLLLYGRVNAQLRRVGTSMVWETWRDMGARADDCLHRGDMGGLAGLFEALCSRCMPN